MKKAKYKTPSIHLILVPQYRAVRQKINTFLIPRYYPAEKGLWEHLIQSRFFAKLHYGSFLRKRK